MSARTGSRGFEEQQGGDASVSAASEVVGGTPGTSTEGAATGTLGSGRPWNKGVAHSPEVRARIGAARRGKAPWNKGKALSEEHRRKIGAAHEGRPLSSEHRQRIAKGMRRRPDDVLTGKKGGDTPAGAASTEAHELDEFGRLQKLLLSAELETGIVPNTESASTGRHAMQDASETQESALSQSDDVEENRNESMEPAGRASPEDEVEASSLDSVALDVQRFTRLRAELRAWSQLFARFHGGRRPSLADVRRTGSLEIINKFEMYLKLRERLRNLADEVLGDTLMIPGVSRKVLAAPGGSEDVSKDYRSTEVIDTWMRYLRMQREIERSGESTTQTPSVGVPKARRRTRRSPVEVMKENARKPISVWPNQVKVDSGKDGAPDHSVPGEPNEISWTRAVSKEMTHADESVLSPSRSLVSDVAPKADPDSGGIIAGAPPISFPRIPATAESSAAEGATLLPTKTLNKANALQKQSNRGSSTRKSSRTRRSASKDSKTADPALDSGTLPNTMQNDSNETLYREASAATRTTCEHNENPAPNGADTGHASSTGPTFFNSTESTTDDRSRSRESSTNAPLATHDLYHSASSTLGNESNATAPSTIMSVTPSAAAVHETATECASCATETAQHAGASMPNPGAASATSNEGVFLDEDQRNEQGQKPVPVVPPQDPASSHALETRKTVDPGRTGNDPAEPRPGVVNAVQPELGFSEEFVFPSVIEHELEPLDYSLIGRIRLLGVNDVREILSLRKTLRRWIEQFKLKYGRRPTVQDADLYLSADDHVELRKVQCRKYVQLRDTLELKSRKIYDDSFVELLEQHHARIERLVERLAREPAQLTPPEATH